MKCPKYISNAIEQRAKCATRFTYYDIMIGEWLEKNNLIDKVELYDIYGGCESYVNPYGSSKRIKEIIESE